MSPPHLGTPDVPGHNSNLTKHAQHRSQEWPLGCATVRFAIVSRDVYDILLRRAVAVAASARAAGNHPFGALLADADGQVLLTAENTVVTGRDVTAHAETNLVRLASARYDAAQLAELTLVTSTEPCPMCSGAIFWAGIGTVVYALSEEGLYGTAPGEDSLLLPCREVFARGGRPVTVHGPFDLPEALEVHADFWT